MHLPILIPSFVSLLGYIWLEVFRKLSSNSKRSNNYLMKPYPKITIIFPNYNGGNEPIECLKSIKKLSYPQKNLEVIIVDNDSKDGSKEEIEKKFPEVYLIKNSKNLG